MVVISSSLLAIAWTAFYLYRRKSKNEPVARSFLLMPNLVMLVGSIWVLFAGLLQIPCDSGLVNDGSTLLNAFGLTAFGLMVLLSIVSIANDRAWFQVISRCLLSLGLATALASRFAVDDGWRFVSCLLYTSPSPRDGLLSRMPSSA